MKPLKIILVLTGFLSYLPLYAQDESEADQPQEKLQSYTRYDFIAGDKGFSVVVSTDGWKAENRFRFTMWGQPGRKWSACKDFAEPRLCF